MLDARLARLGEHLDYTRVIGDADPLADTEILTRSGEPRRLLEIKPSEQG